MKKINIKQLGIKKVVIVRHGAPEPRYIHCTHQNTQTVAEPVDGDRTSIVVMFRCYCFTCGTYVERTHPAYNLDFDIHVARFNGIVNP